MDGGAPVTRITLPWPPSVNRYWRNVNGRTLVSREGRAYRAAVLSEVLLQGAAQHYRGRLRMVIIAHPPDKRRRDLDNLVKAIQDGLEFAGVFDDDGQIDDLRVVRAERVPGGRVEVIIEEVGV